MTFKNRLQYSNIVNLHLRHFNDIPTYNYFYALQGIKGVKVRHATPFVTDTAGAYRAYIIYYIWGTKKL